MTRFLATLLAVFTAFVLAPKPAQADDIVSGPAPFMEALNPVILIQASPGIHLTLSGKKLGIGASFDVLAGSVLRPAQTEMSPGLAAGPFAEVNAVLGEGVSYTLGWRAGLGGLAPKTNGGFVPHGLVTYDYGRTRGAVEANRRGVHARTSVWSGSLSLVDDGSWLAATGLMYPLVPLPTVE